MVMGAAMKSDSRQLAWPFVGRDEELDLVDATLRERASCGVVVSGAAGVGKTRLARELLAAGTSAGTATAWVQGTSAAASIPLGAFVALMPSGAEASDRLHLFRLCADALRERAAGGRVLLGVDDAHLLDAASAALVLHLATSAPVLVVATVRTGEPCPDSIVALWKDAGALRLELQQLSEEQTVALVTAALGGEVEPAVLRWVFTVSEGNVLYLRELVTGALAAGALEQVNGRWQLRTRPRASPALADLISARLTGLAADELEMVQLLALGEPLELNAIARLDGTTALLRLEERGLATVAVARGSGTGGEARLSHPLYGEVVRGTTPALRAARLRVRLAETVQAGGMPGPGDALRVATWLDDAGATIDPALLLTAARQANAASDPDLAERLASRAGATGGVEAALVLARAHALRRRFAEAEELLAGLQGELVTPGLAADYLAERALMVLHLGLRRTGDALGLLTRARDWFAGPGWVRQVEAIELEVRASDTGGEAAAVIEAAERVLQRDDLIPQVRRRASIAYAFSLHQVGRTADARAVSQRLRPAVPLRDDDDVRAFVPWPLVCLDSGYDWAAAEAWLGEAERATRRGGDPLTRGQILSFQAAYALWRGRPVTAARLMRQAIPFLLRRDPQRRLPLAWLYLQMSAAMRGDLGAAREAEAQYRASVAGAAVPYLEAQEARARAALAAAEGRTSDAARTLLSAAASEPIPVHRGYLLYHALRADAEPKTIAPVLQAAAASCDAPLIGAFAQQASALAAGDGAALADAAQALAEIGAWLWAAESAAQAAAAHAKAGRDDSARRALALSSRLQDRCEDVRSPILAAIQLAPAELTRREREVAQFAAQGATNAEIAQQLVLSVRTVESYLYRAMSKLGTSSRRELRSLQQPPRNPAN
jgi:DNA-binding NarL/FixJ family response regulator/chromosome segregation and condensation protein ScpB